MTFLRSAGLACSRAARLLLLIPCAHALGGCECRSDHTPPGVQQSGEVAPRADEVIAVSASICSRDLHGYVTWVAEPFDCGSVWSTGCSHTGGCHLDATVEYDPSYMQDALSTSLAHEIGHFCLETEDDGEANAFAGRVRGLVLRGR